MTTNGKFRITTMDDDVIDCVEVETGYENHDGLFYRRAHRGMMESIATNKIMDFVFIPGENVGHRIPGSRRVV